MDIDFRVAFVLLPVIAAVSWALFNIAPAASKRIPLAWEPKLGVFSQVSPGHPTTPVRERGPTLSAPLTPPFGLQSNQPFQDSARCSNVLGSDSSTCRKLVAPEPLNSPLRHELGC